jgi:hypothetical protein
VTPQVAASLEGIMGNTEQNKGTDRPAGTVDEDANPPLTDPTKADPDRSQETQIPPQDTKPAVPPYEGRT